MVTAEEIIKTLNLQPLPKEGGYFGVTFTADEQIAADRLPSRYKEARNLSGAIYFLATTEQFSAMHRLLTDELYYFHFGDPLEMLFLHPDGSGERKILGLNFVENQQPQLLAPRNSWQGSRPIPKGAFGYSLVSTSMAPGFHESDPEFAEREQLIADFPAFQDLIIALTRVIPINQ